MSRERRLVGFVAALAVWAASPAAAQIACCRVQSNGAAIASESFRCNTSTAETRLIGTGQYEVDFTPVATDVRKYVRLATLDTQGSGSVSGTIGLADRSGDDSSVFVSILSHTGAPTNAGFNLCLF